MIEFSKKKYVLGLLGTFLFTTIFARFVVDVTLYGTLFRYQSWVNVYDWISPLGFGFIAIFAYVYRNLNSKK